MTWTYTPGTIETALDWVRLRIGDTDTNDQQLSDEEINSLIAMCGDKKMAAVQAAYMISAKYRRYGAVKESQLYSELAAEISMDGAPDYL